MCAGDRTGPVPGFRVSRALALIRVAAAGACAAAAVARARACGGRPHCVPICGHCGQVFYERTALRSHLVPTTRYDGATVEAWNSLLGSVPLEDSERFKTVVAKLSSELMNITRSDSVYRNLGPLREQLSSRFLASLLEQSRSFPHDAEFVPQGRLAVATFPHSVPSDAHSLATPLDPFSDSQWAWLVDALSRTSIPPEQIGAASNWRSQMIARIMAAPRSGSREKTVDPCQYGCPHYLSADSFAEAMKGYREYHGRMLRGEMPLRLFTYKLGQEVGSGWGNHVQDLTTAFFMAFMFRRAFLVEFNHPGSIESYLDTPGFEWDARALQKAGVLPAEMATATIPQMHSAHDMSRRFAPATSAPGLGSPPATSAPGLGSPRATSAPGLGSPRATSAPGLGSPPCHICTGTAL